MGFAHFMAQGITTTTIILSSNKTQHEDILVLADPGPPGKVAIKMERKTQLVNWKAKQFLLWYIYLGFRFTFILFFVYFLK